ncbi:MAG: hypothetical protein AB7O62_23890 [Pirellulales bacterium]
MHNPATTFGSTRVLHGGMLALGALLLAAVVGLSIAIGDDGGSLTRNMIRLSLAWYFVSLSLMLLLRPADWSAKTDQGALARWCWTWALACFLVHMLLAFHFVHHWSHAHAVERTRQISGLGEGIFFSYLFTLLWLADAIYWWCRPVRYAARQPWIGRALHGFMLFIVFNGTVVYESGMIRWAGCAMFAGWGLLAWRSWRRRKPWEPATESFEGPA